MRRASPGFSLVELMIVVAITGILAAIAVPNYIEMQLKARRTEIPITIDGIRTCEAAYVASFDVYQSVPVAPRSDAELNKSLYTWVGTTAWNDLGYFPSGPLRGNYQVDAVEGDYTLVGHGDMDDDDTLVVYTATSSAEAAITSASVTYY